jgi:inner membrane protein
MVMGQASLFTAGVTGRVGLAGVFAAVLAALFGFLYVVLRMESMALLAGAIGMFALLSAVMMATRGIAGRPG